ncbi:selenoneine biosynthesis selenosugar synthase SenB [Caldimonas caldifontis]|uniref:selenoneine biosynthesis selenosugar synthase SenB n=1 Tax=Caldimonas caldifontis TaxID=1452508 RepID=UPI001FE35AD6|nr:selenoneine biosynthesis selenosugar synthase SenB [Caldimonas caldifontis]
MVIVCPARPEANNGNWHTARRWSRMLQGHCRIRIVERWQGEPCDLLIALHARRSADSLLRHAQAHPAVPRLLVLTGTDLYRDLAIDTSAQASLDVADGLVVLQEEGLALLPPSARTRATVIHQSVPAQGHAPFHTRWLNVLMVGHLREEKDPGTFWRAAARLAGRHDIHWTQIGRALEPRWAEGAEAVARALPRFRWLGGLPRGQTRQHIRRADVLVNCSRMEGGALVIAEAVRSGTPVLASRMSGNLGMLGPDHAGYFPVGDDAALASLVARCRDEPGFLEALQAQGQRRATLFEPDRERALVLHCVGQWLGDLM